MAAGRLQLVPGEAGTFDLQKNPSGLPVHVFKGLPVSQCQGTKEYAEDSSPSLSLRFNGHFPGGPGLASSRMSPTSIFLELRTMEVTPCGWEGNHRSGVALATRHRH